MKIHPVKDLYKIEIANIKKRNSNQGIGLKSGYPEMDTIMVVVMAWILAPIDVSLTWIRWYREAEEARRRQMIIDFKIDEDDNIY